jgi:hypothetical protein
MMNARMTIGRRGTFKEYKLRTAFTLRYRATKHVFILPHLQYVVIRLRQIQAGMLSESLYHIFMLFILLLL